MLVGWPVLGAGRRDIETEGSLDKGALDPQHFITHLLLSSPQRAFEASSHIRLSGAVYMQRIAPKADISRESRTQHG